MQQISTKFRTIRRNGKYKYPNANIPMLHGDTQSLKILGSAIGSSGYIKNSYDEIFNMYKQKLKKYNMVIYFLCYTP